MVGNRSPGCEASSRGTCPRSAVGWAGTVRGLTTVCNRGFLVQGESPFTVALSSRSPANGTRCGRKPPARRMARARARTVPATRSGTSDAGPRSRCDDIRVAQAGGAGTGPPSIHLLGHRAGSRVRTCCRRCDLVRESRSSRQSFCDVPVRDAATRPSIRRGQPPHAQKDKALEVESGPRGGSR